MDKNRFWEEDWFWTEVTAGITIGITVAAIAGLFQLSAKWLRILKQRNRIKEMISSRIKQMQEAKDLTLPDGKTRYPEGQIRKIFYKELWREVDTELTHKSSEISYEDEKKIRDAFSLINRFLKDDENRMPSIEIYKNYMFTQLEKVKWLNLKSQNYEMNS